MTIPNPIFQKVWKWKRPARIRATIWKIAHGKLLTNDERKWRNMTEDNLCPRCNSHPETMMHLLRDCEEVQSFWSRVIKNEHWSKFFSIGQYAWLDWNLSDNDIGMVHWKWPSIFGLAI